MIAYRQNYAAVRHHPAPVEMPTPLPPKRLTRRVGIRGGMGTAVSCHGLLAEIERTLVRRGISASRFGRDAAHDPKLVFRLRAKPTATPEMVEKLTAFLTDLEQREASDA